MRIKHFIVTYNNQSRINGSLESIFSSNIDHELSVTIINNHSNLKIKEEFKPRVQVLNNETRPDFSTGHLARNWNQAIINGFIDLKSPQCDFLIVSQDDTIFKPDYVQKSVEISEKFDFYACGGGDQFMIFTPNGVKRIGLWDERFCNIGYQEADYFLRAVRYCREKVSINDYVHQRVFNEHSSCPIVSTTTGASAGDEAHMKSIQYHNYSLKIFSTKWVGNPQCWDVNRIEELKVIEPNLMSFVLYPYFEKDINTLSEQKYLLP